MPRKREAICYDCGKQVVSGEYSGDHVPPKGLFAKDLRNCDLWVLPCCRECNAAHVDDDEGLKLLALCGQDLEFEDTRASVVRASRKSLRRKAAELIRSVDDAESTVTHATVGLELDDLQGFHARIAKAVLYKHHERRHYFDWTFAGAQMKTKIPTEQARKIFEPLKKIDKGCGTFCVFAEQGPSADRFEFVYSLYGTTWFRVQCNVKA